MRPALFVSGVLTASSVSVGAVRPVQTDPDVAQTHHRPPLLRHNYRTAPSRHHSRYHRSQNPDNKNGSG